MDTTNLLEGLTLFGIGFGGVFVVLAVIWIVIALLGRLLGGRPETKAAEH